MQVEELKTDTIYQDDIGYFYTSDLRILVHDTLTNTAQIYGIFSNNLEDLETMIKQKDTLLRGKIYLNKTILIKKINKNNTTPEGCL